MNPIIKWTVLSRRTSTIWWTVGVSALIVLTLVFYPAFKDQAAEFQKSFDSLPDTAVQLFGGSTDFFSPIGYLNSQLYFITLPLTLAILAINLGANLIARDEQQKTIEHLLSRPVSRTRLITSKAAAGGLIILVVNAASMLTTAITAKAVSIDVPLWRIVTASLICALLTTAFGSLAFMITAFGKMRVAAVGVATTYALGGYLVDSLAGTVHWLHGPSQLFLFHYYKSEAILRGTYNWWFAGIFVAVTAVSLVIARHAFANRDLQ